MEMPMEQQLTNCRGVVTAGFGGFYEVRRADASESVTCKPRGRLRQKHEKIYTGDRVEISLLEDGTGMIENIQPRQNIMRRPPIANVDQVVIVLAWHLPDYDPLLLDRILLLCRMAGVKTVFCMNKTDLMREEERAELDRLAAAYAAADCPMIAVSAGEGMGVDALRERLKGKVSVFAGPSGVGKSSLLNLLLPEEHAETGAVSERLQRGKHTTRYVRLLPLPDDPQGGMIADAPGFFVLDTPQEVTEDLLPQLYPEYVRLFESEDGCRFDGCRHHKEPACAVRAAVEAGELDADRYARYLRILNEIQTREVKYR